jgi:hypothetical protein
VAASHRSIHPNISGVPWWAAVVIAVTATAVGFAFDAGSGNKQLTYVFSTLYVAGCITAVLAVRQPGVFTAVIQPPLILFCSVPGAYWLFHKAELPGLKDLLINCGYPLIERFPLMLFTSAAALLIGMARWLLQKVAEKRPAASRSRHIRPPLNDAPEPTRERARQSRHGAPTHTRELDAAKPHSRAKVPRDPDLPRQPPPQTRRDPHGRKSRPTSRNSRLDPYQPVEPDEPFAPSEPRRRSIPNRTPAATATHHPISRVRYRAPAATDESHKDTKARSRKPRDPQKPPAESWDYDI